MLDTDVFVDLIRRHPPATTWLASLPEMPFLSGVAALEASFGARSALECSNIENIVRSFPVLWPIEHDFQRATMDFARLSLAHGIGSLDAITASLAIRHGVPIATFNVKHFKAVEGLTIIQPYVR